MSASKGAIAEAVETHDELHRSTLLIEHLLSFIGKLMIFIKELRSTSYKIPKNCGRLNIHGKLSGHSNVQAEN